MHARTGFPILAALALLGGCSLFRDAGLAENEPDPTAVTKAANPDEPSHVVVQHVLIAFDAAGLPGVTRSQAEAERLAARVLADAQAGRDFGELVRLYSDDAAGTGGTGTYAMANWGVPTGADEVERRKMVRGFGALAFSLAPGAIGVVEYDSNASPFGWHVMKRLR